MERVVGVAMWEGGFGEGLGKERVVRVVTREGVKGFDEDLGKGRVGAGLTVAGWGGEGRALGVDGGEGVGRGLGDVRWWG